MSIRSISDMPGQCGAALEPATASADAAGSQVSDPKPLSVLLVEDDVLIRMDAADMLRDLGHEVVETEYGPDALAVLRERHIDVLVTDVGLPGMSGTELAERARQLQPGIGLVFATGNTDLQDGEEGARVTVLGKPYDSASLAQSLSRVHGPA